MTTEGERTNEVSKRWTMKLFTEIRSIVQVNLVRGTKFSIVGLTSFAVVEAALAVFDLLQLTVILATPLSYEVSIVYGFAANDKITVSDTGPYPWYHRILRYNLVYLAGIFIATVIVTILKAHGIEPLIGNVVGALAAFPVNYFISMKTVWKQRVR